MSNEVKVKLPKKLVDRIEDFIRGSEFESVEEFLIFVSEEVMRDEEEEEVEFSEEDEEKVKERLRALGYLE